MPRMFFFFTKMREIGRSIGIGSLPMGPSKLLAEREPVDRDYQGGILQDSSLQLLADYK